MSEILNNWVNEKLKVYNLSMRELARKIGSTHSQVSRILNNKQQAKLDFYLAVAQVFDAIPEMLRVAGLWPTTTPDDQLTFAELLDTVKKLNPEDRQEVLEYAFYRLWKQRDNAANDENRPANNGETAKAG